LNSLVDDFADLLSFSKSTERYSIGESKGHAKKVSILCVLALMLVFEFHPHAAAFSEISKVRKLAEQGDPAAQNKLGFCYLTGEGVAKDAAEAMKWLHRAANRGDASAQKLINEFRTGTI
jgi:TPR repeat protein